MNLLVTNDDGIASPFLHELVAALLAAGHAVYVAAPKTEQSWVGAAKSRSRPVHAAAVDRGFGCATWSIDGTPSDCVNIALDHLIPRTTSIDAVVSGINVGFNASLGFIIASGTIAGAWEGALHGLPAIAFSQALTEPAYEALKTAHDIPDPALLVTLRHSAAHAARLTPALVAATAPQSFVVHNVNFPLPCTAASAVVRAVPAQVVIPRLFTPACAHGTHSLRFHPGEDISPAGPLTDRTALAAGHISHTILDYTRLGR
ncbi:MAG: 5'/3'-nucleotidase SurE [Undibacterium sp.]|nr:5'/3'-nucleotidase SurE [Opitutaceae bacterium]